MPKLTAKLALAIEEQNKLATVYTNMHDKLTEKSSDEDFLALAIVNDMWMEAQANVRALKYKVVKRSPRKF